MGKSIVIASKSKNELIKNLASFLRSRLPSKDAAQHSHSDKPFVLGLSGGSMIETLVEVVGNLGGQVDWTKIKFIFCDERRVPFDDSESIFGGYRKQLIGTLPGITQSHFVAIDPSLTVKDCASDYEGKLKALVNAGDGDGSKLDLLLLGLGPDGHTCSLFPGHPLLELRDENCWVAPISDSPKPPSERVTLTLPILLGAQDVAFVTTGAGKADVIKEILEESGSKEAKDRLPGSLVQHGRQGNTHWFLDEPAASKLTTATHLLHTFSQL